MIQETRFGVRDKNGWACIHQVDGFVPNLAKDAPIMIRGIRYWVWLVETHIHESGDIIQHVLLKTKG